MQKEIVISLSELQSVEVTCPKCQKKFIFELEGDELPDACKCGAVWWERRGLPREVAPFRGFEAFASALNPLKARFRIAESNKVKVGVA
jgi:hypothetical protein